MVHGPLVIEPLSTPPDATVRVPGSKSHTNRALACAALAQGRSSLHGVLFADDTEAMMRSLGELGIGIDANPGEATVQVAGGIGRLAAGGRALDLAQSGTTSRFLLALATLGPGPYELDGDEQLRVRPLGPLLGALRSLGAGIEGEQLPVIVAGGGLVCGAVELPGSISSQFLSALLIAAPGALPAPEIAADDPGEGVEIHLSDELVSKPYIDLTMATMAQFGVTAHNHDYRHFAVAPQRYQPATLTLEPDASAASYFLAAAAITGGRVRIDGLGSDTIQGDMGFVELLGQMGAKVSQGPDWTEVVGTGELVGIDVNMSDISDTAQTLAVVASFATTPTRVRGIGFIRRKETDRIAAVVEQLTSLGIDAQEDPDGFTIHPGAPSAGIVKTYDDHRMAMSFALLGLVHRGIELDDPGCVAKTFPDYFEVLHGLR